MNKRSFLFHRSRYHWLLLLTLVLGVVLASTFLASGPVLIDALIEFGLRRTLLNANLKEDVFRLTLRESADQEKYATINQRVSDYFDRQFASLDVSLIPSGRVGFLYPWEDGEIVLDRRLTLGFYGANLDELEGHVRFEAGGFPELGNPDHAATTSQPDEIPVFIGKYLADALSLKVNDLVPASTGARDSQPGYLLRITGIITPIEYQDAYWLDDFNPIWPRESSGVAELYGVFVPKSAFFTLADTLYPELDVSYSWLVNLSLDRITFDDIPELQVLFSTLDNELSLVQNGLRGHTTIIGILEAYSAEANIARAPLYFLLGIVVLTALYYLVMMSSLYLRQLNRELAVMRSRGAGSSLLFSLELMNGMLFAIAAILGGPIFAWLIVRGFALNGPLAVIAEPGWGLSIPPAAWISASVAGLASMGSILVPLPRALKRSIVVHQQTLVRAGRVPLWQRFYLDVFILVIGIILLYRVELYGSIIGGTRSDPQIDLMLILAPLCLLLGAGAIFLRIFPVILKWGARLASRGRGFPLVLALQHAARDPQHVTRLVLLLMLAMTLGLFSTSLDATLTKNEQDRASYYVGSDLRVKAEPAFVPFDELPDVEANTWVWRSEAALITSGISPGIDFLAVDPETFSEVSEFRGDFSSQSVPDLLASMNADWEDNRIPLPAVTLPGSPEQIGIWFSPSYSTILEEDRYDHIASTTFEIRLRTNQGEDFAVQLLPTPPPDDPEYLWYHFLGDVPEYAPEDYPLDLISIWLHSSTMKVEKFEGIWLDDITVIDRHTKIETLVESFEYSNQFVWKELTYPMRVFCIEAHPHFGDSSLAIYFDSIGISPLRWYGVNRVDERNLQPIPALVSRKFINQTELEIGDLVRFKVRVPNRHEWDNITFKILGEVNYFPTMYETQEAGFVIALREPLFEQIDLYRYWPLQSNEVLISSTDIETTRRGLFDAGLLPDQIFSADLALQELKTNPMAIGLRSVTAFGYYLTTFLSLVGFGTYFYLSTRQRATHYSIQRALGLSPSQLYGTLLVEQIVLMFSGLAFGTVLGLLLNRLTLSGLPLRLGELDTVPPFIVQTDWTLIVQVYVTLVIAFLVALGLAIFFLWRVKIHLVLRIGEE